MFFKRGYQEAGIHPTSTANPLTHSTRNGRSVDGPAKRSKAPWKVIGCDVFEIIAQVFGSGKMLERTGKPSKCALRAHMLDKPYGRFHQCDFSFWTHTLRFLQPPRGFQDPNLGKNM